MSEGNDESHFREAYRSGKRFILSIWKGARELFDRLSSFAQFLLTIGVTALISVGSMYLNPELPAWFGIPEVSTFQLVVVLIGVVLAQTAFYHIRLKQVAKEIRSVTNSNEAVTDGGSTDELDVLLMVAGIGLVGYAIADAYAHDWRIVGAGVGAWFGYRIAMDMKNSS